MITLLMRRRSRGAARPNRGVSGLRQEFDPEILRMTVNRETVVRESLVAMALLAWKCEHGRWPYWLSEVLQVDGAVPSINIVDPWCGEVFQYSGDLRNRDARVHPIAELLTSVGPNHPRHFFSDNPRDGNAEIGYGLRTGEKTWRGEPHNAVHDRTALDIVEGRVTLRFGDESDRKAPRQ